MVTNVTRKKALKICGVHPLELSAECSLRALTEMLRDGELTTSEFLSQIDVAWFKGEFSLQVVPPSFKAVGLPAVAGAAFAPVYLRPPADSPVPSGGIFVVSELAPGDVPMVQASQAVLATRGGCSCHAAIVCRQIGKPCVVGASVLQIDYATRTIRAGADAAAEGTLCMLDGTTGQVALLVGGGATIELRRSISTSTAECLRALRPVLAKLPPSQVNRYPVRSREAFKEIVSLFDLLDESKNSNC